MHFSMVHTNFNVFDLDKSLAFYSEALGLTQSRRKVAKDGSFIIVFLKDDKHLCELELTWMRDRETPYDLGDKEYHIAFVTDDYDGALKKHRDMGVVCYENTDMGIYFIEDPDGYWVEVLPG
ncbi:MAG: lactoylglutathione lyase [Clostridiales bacterium]|jgi:lactoylglutathione lyase|nr:lactoylglutathione lyase [Clostridiales bacterium]